MRSIIWNAVRSKTQKGMILPWWAMTVRAALYPLDFFYWRMSESRGYHPLRDTWLIDGVEYRVHRADGITTIEPIGASVKSGASCNITIR